MKKTVFGRTPRKNAVVIIVAEMAVLGLILAIKDYREMRNDIREIKEKLSYM